MEASNRWTPRPARSPSRNRGVGRMDLTHITSSNISIPGAEISTTTLGGGLAD